jgi:hypothetical protein
MLTQALGRGSSHNGCTTAACNISPYKISAVLDGQCSGDHILLRDYPSAVGHRGLLLWWPTCQQGKEEGNKGHIEEFSYEREKKDAEQGDSGVEGEEESITVQVRDGYLDEEERDERGTAMSTHTGYAMMVTRQSRTNEITTGNVKLAGIEEDVPEV